MLNLYGVSGALIEAFTLGHLLLSRTIITTTGASTYTTPANCTLLFVQCFGAGGSGAGTANSTAGNIAVGAGGSGGGYAAQTVATVGGKTFAARVGITGASGSTQFKSNDPTDPTVFVEAQGGAIGNGINNGLTELFAGIGASFNGSSFGSPSQGGTPGGAAHRISGTVACAGAGGSGAFGGSAVARNTQGNGTAGGQYGGGGSGGLSVNAGGLTLVGTGGQGVCIVWELT